MNTLVLEHPGNLARHAALEPDRPGPGEALVRVHRVGVCRTDLHAFRGHQPFFTYPRILGHELGVEVLAAGPDVAHVGPGDRCAVDPHLPCGHCIACRSGRPNCCNWMQTLGVHIDGGMRRQFVIPAANLHSSFTLSYDRLALVEPLAIGAHAVWRAALGRHETIAVIGADPIGLAVIQFALATGCRVLVVDPDPRRLDFCRARLGMPGDDLVAATAAGCTERLADLTGGDFPTAVFEATGQAASMAAAFELPAHGGRLVFVGHFSGEVAFHDPSFHHRELTLLASRDARPEDFDQVLTMMESGSIDTAPWITHRTTLTEAPDQFAAWIHPDSEVLKAMISLT